MDDNAWCELGDALEAPFMARVARAIALYIYKVGQMGADACGKQLKDVFTSMRHGVAGAEWRRCWRSA